MIPLVGPDVELDARDAHHGIVETDVVTPACGQMCRIAEGITGPVLFPHGIGEILSAPPSAGGVGRIHDVVGSPDIIHDGVSQSVLIAGEVIGALCHGEEGIILTEAFSHHVHVDVDAELVHQFRILFDVLVGSGDLVGPKEIDGPPGLREGLPGR